MSARSALGELVDDRWRIDSEIGSGGISTVYRARDLRGGPDVAVKVLKDKLASDPEFSVRMVREQRAMAALSGTAAVRVHALTTTRSGALCLVMELCEGRDLDDLLTLLEAQGHRMPVRDLLTILAPIVDTLEVAHQAGIIHRDLKPGNIFVIAPEHGGGVRLLDFGLAKLTRSQPLTREGIIVGSPSYIAPETWTGSGPIDQRVDVYSLGAIVFRALGGRVPFEAPNMRKKLELAARGPRPSLRALRPELGAEIDSWVEQALAADPAERFVRARGCFNALIGCLGA
jgi:eukaryotic-like serine/threonine-protein kinase